jgi:hypothetical protein
MFESIHDQAPELATLQGAVTRLEQEAHEAASRVAQLQAEAEGAREDDLLREAKALNEGRRVPKAREPEVRAQIEGASRRAEVLQRRLALAQSDLSRYISEHAEDLDRLALQARADKVREASELAEPLARALHEVQLADADRRALRPYLEEPQEENTGDPEPSITVFGPQTRATAFGERIAGMTLGQLEAVMGELVGWGARVDQGGTTLVGPTPEEGGEGAA